MSFVQIVKSALLVHNGSADVFRKQESRVYKQVLALLSYKSSCQCSFRRATVDIEITLGNWVSHFLKNWYWYSFVVTVVRLYIVFTNLGYFEILDLFWTEWGWTDQLQKNLHILLFKRTFFFEKSFSTLKKTILTSHFCSLHSIIGR